MNTNLACTLVVVGCAAESIGIAIGREPTEHKALVDRER